MPHSYLATPLPLLLGLLPSLSLRSLLNWPTKKQSWFWSQWTQKPVLLCLGIGLCVHWNSLCGGLLGGLSSVIWAGETVCKCLQVSVGGECLFLGVEVLVFAFSIWMCVCVGLCLCESVYVLIEGVHSSRCGLFLPVGDGGRCEMRMARAGWSCFLSNWPDWLLLGNSQALRCHRAWKRGMNHPPSLPAYRNFFPVPRARFHQKS